MALTKHGRGELLPEPDDVRKTSGKDWTEEDQAALDKENAQGDE